MADRSARMAKMQARRPFARNTVAGDWYRLCDRALDWLWALWAWRVSSLSAPCSLSVSTRAGPLRSCLSASWAVVSAFQSLAHGSTRSWHRTP